MAKLTTKARKKIPDVKFGIPSERKYPMPDKNHAANAKARAAQMVNRGLLDRTTKAHIDRMANVILGKKK